MTKTFRATAPDGQTFALKTKRPIGYAIFLKLKDGTYFPAFAKTPDAARRVWGARGTGLTRAVEGTTEGAILLK